MINKPVRINCFLLLSIFLSLFSSTIGYTMEKNPKFVYKVLTQTEWTQLKHATQIQGNATDRQDGFIHLSTAKQVKRIAKKYHPNLQDGVLLKILYQDIEPTVKWEPNSKGELFAHAYAAIPQKSVSEIFHLSVKSFDFDGLDF